MKRLGLVFTVLAMVITNAVASYQYQFIGDTAFDIDGKSSPSLDFGSDIYVSAVDFDVKSSSTFLVTNPLVMKIGGTIVYKDKPTTSYKRISYKFDTPQIGSTISFENRANVKRSVKNMTLTIDPVTVKLEDKIVGESQSASFVVLSDTALTVDNFVTDTENLTVDSVSNIAAIYRVYVTYNFADLGEQSATVSLKSETENMVVANINARGVLPATAEVRVDKVSYTFVDLSWEPVEGAKGYKIDCSNGTYITILEPIDFMEYVGLAPNASYTFAVSAIDTFDYESPYTNEVSAVTLASTCDVETIDDIAISGNDSKLIHTTKNAPIITFKYTASGIGTKCSVDQLVDGQWESVWSSYSGNGTASVSIDRNAESIRFSHSDWFSAGEAKFTEITSVQAMYVEPEEVYVDLGEMEYTEGMTVSYKLPVYYSSMWADVVCEEYLSVDKDSIGAEGCEFGTDTLNITLAVPSEGEFNGTIRIGETEVLVHASFITPVSADNIETAKFSVTPNPVADVVTVNADGVVRVYVYNIAGSLLIRAEGNTVSMASLATATYRVVAEFADGSMKSTNVIKR